MDKSVIISGAGGFFGSFLAQETLSAGFDVHGLYSGSFPTNSNVHWHKWALSDAQLPQSTAAHDCFVHLASTLSQDRDTALAIDLCGLARIVDHRNWRHFFFCSSVDVYGNYQGKTFDEKVVPSPVDWYGTAKLLSERLLDLAWTQSQITNLLIFRPAFILGSHPRLLAGFWGRIVCRLLRNLPIVISDLSEDQLTDAGVSWVAASDLSRWVVAGLECSLTGTFNACSGFFSWQEFFKVARERTGSTSPIVFAPNAPKGEMLTFDRRRFDSSKLFNKLKLSPKVDLPRLIDDWVVALTESENKEKTQA